MWDHIGFERPPRGEFAGVICGISAEEKYAGLTWMSSYEKELKNQCHRAPTHGGGINRKGITCR